MIVVDLGCHTFGADESVNKLTRRYLPDALYGFDPHPDTVPGVTEVGDTVITIERSAAWLYDGEIGLAVAGLDTTVMRDKDGRGEWNAGSVRVPCFDLARWLLERPTDMIVLKLDVEGAEFPLLSYLIEAKADRRLSQVLVEWHSDKLGSPEERRRQERWLTAELACPVEPW